MPLVKRIRRGGSTIVVEAHGEVLFLPSGPFGRWAAVFTERLESFTHDFAPANRRPRWAHYGPRLRTTFDSAVDFDPTRTRVNSAVGSSAPYALYVDQGSGVYAGNGPYKAKVLPPWTRGSPSLYEARWVPPGSHRAVRPVLIKGQKGQFFFQRGIERAFQSMRMRSYQLPGDPRISEALDSIPRGLVQGVIANTPASPGFIAQLEEWRAWRDARWAAGLELGHNKGRNARHVKRLSYRVARERWSQNAVRGPRQEVTQEQKREQWREASRRYRERNRREGRKPNPRKKTSGVSMAARAAMSRTMAAYAAKNPSMQVLRADRNGFWVRPKRGGEQRRINWSIRIIDLIYGRA